MSTTEPTIAAELSAGLAAANTLAPAFGPNAMLAVTVASLLLNAATAAANGGVDVTDDQVNDLLSADAAVRLQDIALQKQLQAAGDTSGTIVP